MCGQLLDMGDQLFNMSSQLFHQRLLPNQIPEQQIRQIVQCNSKSTDDSPLTLNTASPAGDTGSATGFES